MKPTQDACEALPRDWAWTVLDSVTDGVFTVDHAWRISSFNHAAEHITGIPREKALGRSCCDVFRADICESFCALKETMSTGRAVVNRTVAIMHADGRQRPISISTALLRDGSGKVIGGVETFRDLSVVEELRKQLTARHTFHDVVYRGHAMEKMLSVLPDIAASESTVLITGESGTGKELIARALHSLSPRTARPFIAVNCGALPDTLLESELYGYKAGAFTGALRDRPGRFRQAERGTIFLDEIGDISHAMQIRLLRVLQEREYEPLGASASEKADVRVVCATNQDLEALVERGEFRQDLFYRVNVVRVRVPPLRERKEDIPLLVDHFVTKLNRLRGHAFEGVSSEVMARFMSHDWPGNVRELENAIEHGSIVCQGPLIERPGLPETLAPEVTPQHTGMTLRDIEARAVLDALRRNGWRKMAAARELGINKTTLWRKMNRLEIEVPDTSPDDE